MEVWGFGTVNVRNFCGIRHVVIGLGHVVIGSISEVCNHNVVCFEQCSLEDVLLLYVGMSCCAGKQ